jgi:hypothetical protein
MGIRCADHATQSAKLGAKTSDRRRSPVSITEELLEGKSCGPGSRKPRLTAVGSVALTTH